MNTICNICPYREIGGGFVLDEYHEGAAILFILEAASADEVVEGRPLSGKTGWAWEHSLLPYTGFSRSRISIMNTLRCRPPKNKYPIGKLKILAEKTCRSHDRVLEDFKPTIWGVTLHPSALFRTPNHKKLVVRALTRAGELARAGERPALIMGARPLEVFLPHLKGGVKKWQSHWEGR